MGSIKPTIHGRDHCPGGPDPIPAACLTVNTVVEMPWARIYALGSAFGGTNQTINNNTITRLDMSTAVNSYTTYFTARTTQDDILILQKGYYAVRISVMDNSFSDGDKIKFVIDGMGTTHEHVTEFLRHIATTPLGALWLVQMEAGDGVQPWIFHKTGVATTIAGRMCEVAYLGTYTPAASSGSGIFV